MRPLCLAYSGPCLLSLSRGRVPRGQGWRPSWGPLHYMRTHVHSCAQEAFLSLPAFRVPWHAHSHTWSGSPSAGDGVLAQAQLGPRLVLPGHSCQEVSPYSGGTRQVNDRQLEKARAASLRWSQREGGGCKFVHLGGPTGIRGVAGRPVCLWQWDLALFTRWPGRVRCLTSMSTLCPCAGDLPLRWVHTLSICVPDPSWGSPLKLAPPGWCLPIRPENRPSARQASPLGTPLLRGVGGWGRSQAECSQKRGMSRSVCAWEKKRTAEPGGGSSLTAGPGVGAGKRSSRKSPCCMQPIEHSLL